MRLWLRFMGADSIQKATLTALLIGGLGLLYVKWELFNLYAYTSDVFSYSRALSNTWRGRFMWDPTHSFLFGNHSYLVLLVFLPFYLIGDTAFVLIGSAVVAHVWASVMVWRLSAKVCQSESLGWLLGGCYFTNVLLLEHVLMPVYGFQPDVLAPAFLFSALYFYFSQRHYWCLGSFALLSSVKEEFALLAVGLVGLLVLDRAYEKWFPRLSLGAGVAGNRSRKFLALLSAITAGLAVISVATLTYGKSVTEFSIVPTLRLEGLLASLGLHSFSEGLDHLAYYGATLGFLPILCPELLCTVLIRVFVNFQVYHPHTPELMSVGSGWSWGNVSVVNLMFLGLIVAVKRLKSTFKSLNRPLIVTLTCIVVWNGYAITRAHILGFKPAIAVWRDQRRQADAEAIRSLQESVRLGKRSLSSRVSPDGIVLISPMLIKDFGDTNAVVLGFARNVNRELLNQAQGAVLQQKDRDGIAYVNAMSEFDAAYSDRNITAFSRREGGTKVSSE